MANGNFPLGLQLYWLLARRSRADITIPAQDSYHASASGSRTITREMITKWNILDAYDAVERAGGYKLTAGSGGQVSVKQGRGRSSLNNGSADRPVLVVDGSMLADFSALRQIRAAQIERIDLLSASDATQRYGTTASGAGAIVVTTGAQP